jgi:hypothetical protein
MQGTVRGGEDAVHADIAVFLDDLSIGYCAEGDYRRPQVPRYHAAALEMQSTAGAFCADYRAAHKYQRPR